MEISGYHTPKASPRKTNKNVLNYQNKSPVNLIKRRKSFIPYSIFKSCQNNNENSCKGSKSIKKSSKVNFSGVAIPEERENKNKIPRNMKSDSFSNLINDIYTKESHLNKNIISGSNRKLNDKIKRNYISNKTLFKESCKRMSSINSLSLFNKMKNKDNTNKDGLTMNSNFNTPKSNHKLLEKIDNILHKKELTKNDKETVLNFLDRGKDYLSSPKHKINKNNSIRSPKSNKKRKKNNNVKFKGKNKQKEDQKTTKEKTENEENSNTILPELKDKPSKGSLLKTFLCCLKNY